MVGDRVVLTIATVALGLTVAACTGGGHEPPADTRPGPSRTPIHREVGDWYTVTDDKTGVRFRFPSDAEPRITHRMLGDIRVETRLYQALDEQGYGLAISLTTGPVDFRKYDAEAAFHIIARNNRRLGALDQHLSAVRRMKMQGRDAFGAKIKFSGPQGARTYWRLQTAVDRNFLIMVQLYGDTQSTERDPFVMRYTGDTEFKDLMSLIHLGPANSALG